MKKSDISRQEIAKKFELPERQSKIDFLLKQDGQKHCICRQPDNSRFMIGCDACEKWYHGDCINITEAEAKNIKNFYCIRCQMEDSTLETQWKTRAEIEADDTLTAQVLVAQKPTTTRRNSRRCGECDNCLLTENCGKCENCQYIKKHGKSSRVKVKCKRRICKNVQSSKSPAGKLKHRKHESEREFGTNNAHLCTDEPRQCYGPNCINSARYGSKYCSDECGMKLASVRIFQILPQRLQEWSLSPCVANERNEKQLNDIRQQQIKVQESLYELEQKRLKLEEMIQYAISLEIDAKYEEDQEDELNSEMTSMYCITCGHEIHTRTAIKHIERCFNKYESQSSFGSIFKSKIEGSALFCDFYNPTNETYCKRLKVLCPEHCKDRKITEDEVCGCPLVKNVFTETGEYCRAPKKSCIKHFAWEKLRRAELDMQCVREWLKLDELVEQERQIRQQLDNRGGVLGLMLHSTYNHKVIEKLVKSGQ